MHCSTLLPYSALGPLSSCSYMRGFKRGTQCFWASFFDVRIVFKGLARDWCLHASILLGELVGEMQERRRNATRSMNRQWGSIQKSALLLFLFQEGKYYARGRGALALSRKLERPIRVPKHAWEVWPTDPSCNIKASASVCCIYRSKFLNARRKGAEVGFGSPQWRRDCSFELKFTSWLCLGSYPMIGRVCWSQIWVKEIMFHYLLCYAPIIEWEHGFGILNSRWEEARWTVLVL
jgi:hypothetical protein